MSVCMDWAAVVGTHSMSVCMDWAAVIGKLQYVCLYGLGCCNRQTFNMSVYMNWAAVVGTHSICLFVWIGLL